MRLSSLITNNKRAWRDKAYVCDSEEFFRCKRKPSLLTKPVIFLYIMFSIWLWKFIPMAIIKMFCDYLHFISMICWILLFYALERFVNHINPCIGTCFNVLFVFVLFRRFTVSCTMHRKLQNCTSINRSTPSPVDTGGRNATMCNNHYGDTFVDNMVYKKK